MKPNKLEIIRKCIEKEKRGLLTAIDKLVIARDESPLPSETRSDTSRIQTDKMITALKEKLTESEKLIHNLPKEIKGNSQRIALWSYAQLNGNDAILKLILVPEGYGGKEIDGIKFVSVTTPLGVAIIGNTSGRNIIVNECNMTITSIQ